MIRKPFLYLYALALCLLPGVCAHAQLVDAPPSKLEKFMTHVDMGLNGTGVFTKTVSGTNYQGTNVTQTGSNTFGGLFDIGLTKSPYVGMEINIGYQRFTQTFTCCSLQGGAQSNMKEFTLGYVVHPKFNVLGAKPRIAVGTGVMDFTPTKNGGQGLLRQARQTYYYSVGADIPAFADFFAIRVGFRQNFYLAPDFGQNYLKIKQHTTTSEPVIGFIFHF